MIFGRVYQLAVCSLCGSDRIMSSEEDSWCEDCKEWMSAEEIDVAPIPHLEKVS